MSQRGDRLAHNFFSHPPHIIVMSWSLLRLFLLRSQNLIIPDKRLGSGYTSCRQINNLSIFFPPHSSFLEKSGKKRNFSWRKWLQDTAFPAQEKKKFPWEANECLYNYRILIKLYGIHEYQFLAFDNILCVGFWLGNGLEEGFMELPCTILCNLSRIYNYFKIKVLKKF